MTNTGNLSSWRYDIGLFVLRVMTGGLMLVNHGLPKLIGFNEKMNEFPDPIGLGNEISLALTVFAEFFCALALMLGIYTRIAIIPLIITMLTAAFVIHWDDPFSKKEFALLYAIPFLAMVFIGPGKYSIDSKIHGDGSN